MKTTTKYHKNLAKYFKNQDLWLGEEKERKPNTRKVLELPYQQTKGRKWSEVTN